MAAASASAFTLAAYTSTYSWPPNSISRYMISSVIDRSTNRSPAIPSYREKSSGRPMTMVMRCGRHILDPMGLTLSVPIMTSGTTGTPDSRAIRATPVLPLYSRPSGERVPSG